MRTTKDEWLQGYAVALANVYRNFHEAGIVRETARGDGIKLSALIAAGADEGDIEQLIAAGVA